MSSDVQLDNSPRMNRILQTILDMSRGDLRGLLILDLGCAHGAYSLELAKRGATTVGLEGRQAWVDHANQLRVDLGISGARFICDDARNISAAKHGVFDIVLCLGLLYHLDAKDAVDLLRRINGVCRGFTIIDTQIALEPVEQRLIYGESYSGWLYREHPEGAAPDEKSANLGASLDEDFSFWFTKPSLLNALKAAGFSSVMEVRNPIDNMYANGEFKLHEDVVTMLAMIGQPVGDFLFSTEQTHLDKRWPEAIDDYILERPWTKPRLIPKPVVEIASALPLISLSKSARLWLRSWARKLRRRSPVKRRPRAVDR